MISIYYHRDNFRQLVVESGLCSQKTDASLQVLEQWLTVSHLHTAFRSDMRLCLTIDPCAAASAVRAPAVVQEMRTLSQAVAEAGFVQYASHANKMELQEFVHFAKVRYDVHFAQGLLRTFMCIGSFALAISLTRFVHTFLQKDSAVQAFFPLFISILDS
jgi:hypothetical protein